MPKYRKRPVEAEARQYTDEYEARSIVEWANDHKYNARLSNIIFKGIPQVVIVLVTPGGSVYAHLKDWVVKDAEGGFYPVTPSIFEATYIQSDDGEYSELDKEYDARGARAFYWTALGDSDRARREPSPKSFEAWKKVVSYLGDDR